MSRKASVIIAAILDLLSFLKKFKKKGIPVFNCEYTLNHTNKAYPQSYQQGFIPYCSRRSLSKISTTPPPKY